MEHTAVAQGTTEDGDLGDIDANGTTDRESRGLSLAFSTWHRLLRTLLVVEVPLLAMFAFFREVELSTWAPMLVVPVILVGASSAVGSERFRAGLVSLGFVWCSWLLILWSGGATEAHFHLLIVIGLIGLYRDTWALGLAFVATALLYLGVGVADPALIYNSPAAIASPLVWGFVYIVAVLGAVAIPVFTWRGTREAEDDSAERAAEEVAERAEVLRQREVASVYATVARRSQTLLERQLDLIEKLEQDEKDPGTLQDLFSLDHLATRMNREAASMLVLAGGEPNRRVVGRPPLSEVARGAVGEIEDYTRVDVLLADDRPVVGRVVAPLVHLLSELIENAASYSPPASRVEVIGATAADGSYTMQIVDRGIGLDEAKLAQYNHLLANPENNSPADSQRLGLDVVSRLAGRHGLPVQLSVNASGPGVTATISIPDSLLGEAGHVALATAGPAADLPMPKRVDVEEPLPPASEATEQRRPSPFDMPEAVLPAVEPAPPVPVGAAAGSSGSPAWAQATGRGAAATSNTPVHIAKVREPVGAGVGATGEGPRMGSTVPSWSYAGHLDGSRTTDHRTKRRIFGRRRSGGGPDPTPIAAVEGPIPAVVPETTPPVDSGPRDAFGQGDDLDALLSASRVQPRPQTSPSSATPSQRGQSAPADAAQATSRADSGAQARSQAAEAAASVLDDLPGMGSSPSTPATPRATEKAPPVQMPSSRAGQGPTLPGRPRQDEARPTPPASQPARTEPADPAEQARSLFTAEEPAGVPAQPSPGRSAVDRLAAQRLAAERAAAAERSAASPPVVTPAETARPSVADPSPVAQERAPAAPEPASTAPVADTSGSDAPSGIGSPLPQRRRGTSLPAPLRAPVEGEAASRAAAAPVSREQSRSLLSSYQSRLQAGRKAAEEQVSQSDSDDDTPAG